MISAICWKWGPLFSALYVNRMRSMLERHLHLPHRLYCVTDDSSGLDHRIAVVVMPSELGETPRCRRRMQQYSADFDAMLGDRLLSIDLDVVIVDDITPLVQRTAPICMWRVGYARVLSGSFVLWNAGALDGAWRAYQRDPLGFPKRAQPGGVGSDQAMLNLWLKESRTKVSEWTERDGIRTFFGAGYEDRAHLGVGPNSETLPPGTRMVVLGSEDKAIMDERRLPWVAEHWR